MQNTSAAPIDRPHQAPERLDDLEGAPLTRVGVERGHGLDGQIGQLTAVEVLAHALVDARVGALQIEQRAHDIDVERLAGELRRRDDLVRQRQHQLGELGVAELGIAQLVERRRIEGLGSLRQPAASAGQARSHRPYPGRRASPAS